MRRVTGGPDLRLVNVNRPMAPLRHRSLARDRLEIVKPRCALMQRRGTASRHNVTANIGRRPFVVASNLYDWVIRGSGPLPLG